MYRQDAFSRELGIEIIAIEPGECILRLQVTSSMLNGFFIAHGGITYSLADSALAFAANAHGYHAVSIDTSINHFSPVNESDSLTAHAKELNRTKTIGVYAVTISNQKKETIAFFKGVVSIKNIVW